MSHWEENVTQTIERERYTQKAIEDLCKQAAKQLEKSDRARFLIVPSYRETVRKTLKLQLLKNDRVYCVSRWRWIGTYEPGTHWIEIEQDVREWFSEYDRWSRRGFDPAVAMDPVEEVA